MAYLPVGLSLKGKNILLVGGGEIAYFKYDKIVQFEPENLIVVAKEFNPKYFNLNYNKFQFKQKAFEENDLVDIDYVIVAIEDQVIQREIYQICKAKKILCNCVDLLDCCDFIFTAFVKKDDIVISINTNGKVPGLSAVLKDQIESTLPKNLKEIFNELVQLRASLTPGKERMNIIRNKAKELMQMGDIK